MHQQTQKCDCISDRKKLTRRHWGRSAARPVQDGGFSRLESVLGTVEAIQTREHGVHGGLKQVAAVGAADGAARGGQRGSRREVRGVVQLGLQHDGRLVGDGLGRCGGCHDHGIAVQSWRLRAGRVGSRVDGSRGEGRHHGVHGHLLLRREVLSDLVLGLRVVEVEGSLSHDGVHHSSFHCCCQVRVSYKVLNDDSRVPQTSLEMLVAVAIVLNI